MDREKFCEEKSSINSKSEEIGFKSNFFTFLFVSWNEKG